MNWACTLFGIDISAFNSLIGNCKVTKYNISDLWCEIIQITNNLEFFIKNFHIVEFEEKLLRELNAFNNKYFPVQNYIYRLRNKLINEREYGVEKEKLFLLIYERLVSEYGIKLQQDKSKIFLDKWYSQHIRNEIDLIFGEIKKIQNSNTKKIISVILSRTI
ncbi:hypothetical protein AGMMS49925_04940 [Deltaproteobacteria bacterium]|nr:hypothetical protein AGMMS49925_04940 [Deltaproteobacteria bacterium]